MVPKLLPFYFCLRIYVEIGYKTNRRNPMKPRILSPDLIYYSTNGCLVYKGEILIRLVYSKPELTEILLETIKTVDKNIKEAEVL